MTHEVYGNQINQIGRMIGSSLRAWDSVVNLDVLSVEQRFSTVRTQNLLMLNHSLHCFGVLSNFARPFCPLAFP